MEISERLKEIEDDFDGMSSKDKQWLIDRVRHFTEAGSHLGLQCVNIGMYGPMKISPGKCICSTCNFRKALEKE